MRFIVGFQESVDTYMGVFLGGCKAFMAQQFLDGPEIGPCIQHMGCEGMSQSMR